MSVSHRYRVTRFIREEERVVETREDKFIKRIRLRANLMRRIFSNDDWYREYLTGLYSDAITIICHSNIKDLWYLCLDEFYNCFKNSIYVVYSNDANFRNSSFFYPKSPTVRTPFNAEEISLREYVDGTVQDGSCRVFVANISRILTQKGLENVFIEIKRNMEEFSGNKLVILTPTLAEIPTELLDGSVVVELPLPSLEVRERIIKLEMERLRNLGYKINVSPTSLAFLLGGLDYVSIKKVISLAEARAKLRSSDVIKAEDIGEEKAKLLGGVMKFLKPIKGDFPWSAYKNQFVKKVVESLIITPLEQIMRGIKPITKPVRLLLMGPPGTGKSILIKAIKSRLKWCPMFALEIESILSSYLGESNKNLQQALMRVSGSAPTVLLIDEIDTIFTRRGLGTDIGGSMVMNQLQGQFFKWAETVARKRYVIIIGATNRPQDIDEALISRFNVRIPVNPPKTQQERYLILKSLLGLHVKESRGVFKVSEELDRCLQEIARRTDGYTPRELRNIIDLGISIMCTESEKYGKKLVLQPQHLWEAFNLVKPPNREEIEEASRTALRWATVKF
mgnify:CR=1 FL=1